MTYIDLETQKRIASFLPRALDVAISTYEDMLTEAPSATLAEKDLPEWNAGRHKAYKAFLAHIVLLFKFAHQLVKSGAMGRSQEEEIRHIQIRAAAEKDLADLEHVIKGE